MQIDAITTGTVQITTAMRIGRPPGRIVRAALDREYTAPLPIHAWLIRHPDGPILVDSGELSSSRDMPIARFHVGREDEIDRQLARFGVEPSDLQAVVITHLHGDHMNGAARLSGARILVGSEALTRFGRRALRRRGIEATSLELGGRSFGAFPRSASLSADGNVVAVPIPGHAAGQIAVVVVEDGQHVMIGADSAYSQRQLLERRVDGVSVSARRAIASMGSILDHARRHPTVYLPSHDPASVARLEARAVLEA